MEDNLLSKLTIIILIIAIPITVYLIGQRTGFFGKASISDYPKQIKVTNISDNSFTVSWVTDKKSVGFVSYGESEKFGGVAADDRDNGAQKTRFTHHVTVKNLDPEKVYFFKINSEGKAYQQKTASTTSDAPPLAKPIFGSILNEDGKAPKEAIVFVTPAGGTPLSTFTRDGKWLITLNNARLEDLSAYISLNKDDRVQIFVQSPEGQSEFSAQISDKALPDIVIK